MDEAIVELRQQIVNNFNSLTDDEKDVVRRNKGTEYARIIRKIIPEAIISGLSSGEPANLRSRKRGLAAR